MNDLARFNAFLNGKAPFPDDIPTAPSNERTYAFRYEPTCPRMRTSKAATIAGLKDFVAEMRARGWKVDPESPGRIDSFPFVDERARIDEIRYAGTAYLRGTDEMFSHVNRARPMNDNSTGDLTDGEVAL